MGWSELIYHLNFNDIWLSLHPWVNICWNLNFRQFFLTVWGVLSLLSLIYILWYAHLPHQGKKFCTKKQKQIAFEPLGVIILCFLPIEEGWGQKPRQRSSLKLNKFCPPNRRDDLCLGFCPHSSSSMQYRVTVSRHWQPTRIGLDLAN